jgi:two-component system, chemotaxis family, chemotaxis protein CheY
MVGDLMVSKRVMIVDDAIFMRKVLREILTENGYDVVGEVNRGTDVLEKFKDWKPDLVTMDIMLPGIDGIDAVREIMKVDKDARIVMISALGQDELVDEALKAGAKGFIVKPFIPSQVIDVIKKILG